MLTDLLKSTQSVATPSKVSTATHVSNPTTKVVATNVSTTKVVAPKPTTKVVDEKPIVDEPKVQPTVAPKVAPAQAPQSTPYLNNMFVPSLARPLRKVEMWFSNPGVGKTTLAKKTVNEWKQNGIIDDYDVINCHEEMTVQSLFKTTMTNDEGKWVFPFNKFFNMITDNMKKRYVIILDEFNLLPMTVQKGLQPTLDDTDGLFSFENKVYDTNPNVSFILTMNHKDVGTNRIADAILDRVFPVFFKDLSSNEVAIRSQFPVDFINLLERIYNMFSNLGEIPEFHKSTRQLKNLHGLNKEQFKEYIVAQLEFAGIEWQQVMAISPEFQNALDEFDRIQK